MKSILFPLLTAALLLSSSPAQAEGWVSHLVEWVACLFSPAAMTTPDTTISAGQKHTPLAAATASDTLRLFQHWPEASVAGQLDADRYSALLAQSTLIANPGQILPVTAATVRVIYRSGHRPMALIDMAQRFADIQEIAFTDDLPQRLLSAPVLPTLIVAEREADPRSAPWYHPLYDAHVLAQATLLHFGKADPGIDFPDTWALLHCPTQHRTSERLLIQAFFGAQSLTASLTQPLADFPAGAGEVLTAVRGGYRLPEIAGLDRTALERADNYIQRGIRYRAMPGAQLVVLKGGHVVYEKAYGHHTYRRQAVSTTDLYDLASVTKAAATTLAVMKLYDDGQLSLSAPLRQYLPELKGRPVGRYTIEQLLAHHTGLQAELPLDGLLGKQFVSDVMSDNFQLPVGPDRYLDTQIPLTIRERIRGDLWRTRRPIYLYSDLNFYLLQLVVESISGESLDVFVARTFYTPLQLGRLTFRPLEQFPASQLVPSIHEPWMRGGLLRGYVHDEGAALLGGVAGHAGLFGNARQLGQLFQLILNEGTFAGQQLLRPETVRKFTGRNRFNHRALGFDRLAAGWPYVVTAGASEDTFGHLGFTGTSVWADPDNNLVFVLLTNRVFPDARKDVFQRMQIRGKVHKSIYQALLSPLPAK